MRLFASSGSVTRLIYIYVCVYVYVCMGQTKHEPRVCSVSVSDIILRKQPWQCVDDQQTTADQKNESYQERV